MSDEQLFVVGVDGSPDARRALAWALQLAARAAATVQVVTAYGGADAFLAAHGWEQHMADAIQEKEIEAACARLAVVPVIAREVTPGNPVAVLTDPARGADLLVIGTHGHGRLRTALLGSTGEGCIRHAACPVVVVAAHGAT
jgi:nucleotide-binding universal stress UspA family protein